MNPSGFTLLCLYFNIIVYYIKSRRTMMIGLRDSIRGYQAAGKNAGKELKKVWGSTLFDPVSKENVKNALLGNLPTDISESAKVAATLRSEGDSTKAHILYKNEQINESGIYLNNLIDNHLDMLESMANTSGALELNRAVVLPTLMTTYLSSSGKDKMPYRTTATEDVKRRAKVIYYHFGDKVYSSAETFRNAAILAKASTDARNAKHVFIDLTKVVDGEISFETNKVIEVKADAAKTTINSKNYQGYTVTETSELVAGLTLKSQAKVTHLKYTDGTKDIIVASGHDTNGKTFELGGYNKLINMKGIKSPFGKTGNFIAEYDSENKSFTTAATTWGLVGFVLEITPTIWQEGAGIEATAAEPEIKIEYIDRKITKKCISTFTYNPETKVLWEDLAGLDICNEALLAFQEYKINYKDAAVFRDIQDSMSILRELYEITGDDSSVNTTITGAITNGYIKTSLDYDAATDKTRYLQDRQPSKFEKLTEHMGYCSLYFRKFTHANSIVTNWGINSSAAIFVSKQQGAISSESSIGGVKPINTVYYFEHGGVPMKVVISEREDDYVMPKKGTTDPGVVMNGYPLFNDENIESKAFFQWFIWQQTDRPDYRLTSNPLQVAMIDIDNFDILTYGHMGAEIKLTNLHI